MDSFRSENYRRLAEAVRRRITPGRPYVHLGTVLAREIAAALEEAAGRKSYEEKNQPPSPPGHTG